jgi:hypothetical protein
MTGRGGCHYALVRKRLLLPALVLAVLPCGTRAAEPSPGATALLDAYLAASAPSTPGYRKDIRPTGGGLAGAPAGRLTGFSRVIGPFTYLPRTAADLSPGERAAIGDDPRFAPFAAATRLASARGSGAPVFDIPPAEMLRHGPVLVALAAGGASR